MSRINSLIRIGELLSRPNKSEICPTPNFWRTDNRKKIIIVFLWVGELSLDRRNLQTCIAHFKFILMKSTTISAPQISDVEVIQKILNGDKLIFELLMRRHNQAIYKIGRSYGFTHEDTQDLMQEAHLTAYLNLAKFENRSQYQTWLIRIMINKCLYRLGKAEYKLTQAREHSEAQNIEPMIDHSNSYNTERNVLNHELAHVLEHTIEQIPEDYRMVFMLREQLGQSVLETSETLGITETNVKVRLNRAKAMLREKLENYYSISEVYELNLIYCNRVVENILEKIKAL
jgi:RNA polymerase sigma factor (sigma-70 family)